MDISSRTALLIGEDKLNILKKSTVAIFGVGGVGGSAVEALARSNVGTLYIFDGDIVNESNINRQVIATSKTVGKDKVEAFKDRILSINGEAKVVSKKTFVLPENINEIDFTKFDYVVDAVDTVSAKIAIICKAKENNIPVISSMGTGGKLDVTSLKVGDVFDTKNCPLAKVMRRELRARNITNLKTVYSEEEGVKAKDMSGQKIIPSMIFVPSTAGLLIAKEVVTDLINKEVTK